jgi:hypothetical protein
MIVNWTSLPFRKFLERLLWIHMGKPLGRGSVSYPKRFKTGAKKYMKEEIQKLPPCQPRILILKALPKISPPKSLVLQTYLLSATAKSAPRHEDIMVDVEICDLIQISGMLSLPLSLLWGRLQEIPLGLGNHIKYGDIEKFQYFFWNTSEKDGWSYNEKEVFYEFLNSDKELSSEFRRLLRYGFGTFRNKVALEYGFSLTPEGRKNSFNLLVDTILTRGILASQMGDTEGASFHIQSLSRLARIVKDLNIEYEIQKDVVPENALKMLKSFKSNQNAG